MKMGVNVGRECEFIFSSRFEMFLQLVAKILITEKDFSWLILVQD